MQLIVGLVQKAICAYWQLLCGCGFLLRVKEPVFWSLRHLKPSGPCLLGLVSRYLSWALTWKGSWGHLNEKNWPPNHVGEYHLGVEVRTPATVTLLVIPLRHSKHAETNLDHTNRIQQPLAPPQLTPTHCILAFWGRKKTVQKKW